MSLAAYAEEAEIQARLAAIPARFRRTVADEYACRAAEYQHNHHLSPQQAQHNAQYYLETLQDYGKDKTFLNHSEDSLRHKAKRYARSALRLIGKNNYAAACFFAEQQQIAVPHKNWSNLADQWHIAHDRLQALLLSAKPTNTDQAIQTVTQQIQTLQGEWNAIKARLTHDQWWSRQLIKRYDRQFEQAAIDFACVRKHQQAYVSDASLAKIQARQQRSLKRMQTLQLVSDQGDEVDMLDIINASPANPAIRRAELMNRLHGFEQYAHSHQHVAEFYTLTAPSKYHPSSTKYNQSTPRQTQQQYFSPLWAKIRSHFNDKGLSVYGFRIAEPHGDACPHWHILLFMPPLDRAKVRHILKDYALREDGDEQGAAKNRFDVATICKEKGSAIGYIAKYIAKNVDGFGMENDQTNDGTDLAIDTAALRVRAWASVWGIRQFQQIGGSSISVWRELRRLKDQQISGNLTLETARKAADDGNWHAYLEAQGGLTIPMKTQAIQLYHQWHCDETTGALYTNQYGENVQRIKGIQTEAFQLETRLKQWTMQEKPPEEESEAEASAAIAGLELEGATALAVDLPWSPVNNCRNAEIAPAEVADFSPQSTQSTPQKPTINPQISVKTAQKLN